MSDRSTSTSTPRKKMRKVFIAWKLVNGKKETVAETTDYTSRDEFKESLNELNIKFDGVDSVNI